MNALLKIGELPLLKVLMAAVVISGLYYLVGYDNGSSVEKQTSGVEQQVGQANDEIKKVDKELDEIHVLQRAQERDAEKLNFLLGYIPEKLTKIELMKTLSNEAKSVGASIQSITDISKSALAKETEFYEEIGIQVELAGSFSQMVLFLSNLTRLTQIVTLEALALKKGAADADTLLMSATVKGYKYVQRAAPASAGKPGAKPVPKGAKAK